MNRDGTKFKYPGIRSSVDGSGAVVWVETAATTGAIGYPITPSTNMPSGYQQAVADGATNVWGEKLTFFEPESEHSAASGCEGYALAGGRVANFTSAQGLILMKEVLYTISGKRLPAVFHIGARALTSHSLNIHAGHDDVMGVADVGWGMLFARNVQETDDFALISRKAAEESFTPFFNIQDGFITTHTVETAYLPERELVKEYLKPPKEALKPLMDTHNPLMVGVVQGQDSYMQGKVAQRAYYDLMHKATVAAMDQFYELTGRRYGLVETHRMEDAEYAFVGMGSFMDTAKSVVDWLRQEKKEKVGCITVFSYRPFPAQELVNALRNVKVVSVLERMDDGAAPENPLAGDLKAALADAAWGREGYPTLTRIPIVQHGAGGLGGRDVRAGDWIAILENMKAGKKGKTRYCVGIRHADAIHSEAKEPDIRPKGSFSLRGHSIGGTGSVTTNKIIASVCSDLFDMTVQAFPKYGAEKKGLPTTFFLTIAPDRILFHQELREVDMVLAHNADAFEQGDPLGGLREGGILFIQASGNTPEEIWSGIPASAKKKIAKSNARLFAVDSATIAKEVASLPELIQRMQGIVLLGVFLRVSPFAQKAGLDKPQLLERVEKIIRKYFGKRGEKVVADNMTCCRRGYESVVEIPRALWKV
jgi:pyruvate-ferredoxin/flavodoxin oxidoreductase